MSANLAKGDKVATEAEACGGRGGRRVVEQVNAHLDRLRAAHLDPNIEYETAGRQTRADMDETTAREGGRSRDVVGLEVEGEVGGGGGRMRFEKELEIRKVQIRVEVEVKSSTTNWR